MVTGPSCRQQNPLAQRREAEPAVSMSQVNGCLSWQLDLSLERLLPHLAQVIVELAELEHEPFARCDDGPHDPEQAGSRLPHRLSLGRRARL